MIIDSLLCHGLPYMFSWHSERQATCYIIVIDCEYSSDQPSSLHVMWPCLAALQLPCIQDAHSWTSWCTGVRSTIVVSVDSCNSCIYTRRIHTNLLFLDSRYCQTELNACYAICNNYVFCSAADFVRNWLVIVMHSQFDNISNF